MTTTTTEKNGPISRRYLALVRAGARELRITRAELADYCVEEGMGLAQIASLPMPGSRCPFTVHGVPVIVDLPPLPPTQQELAAVAAAVPLDARIEDRFAAIEGSLAAILAAVSARQ